jgi:ABC-type hemin transport system ATPase subunit
VAPNGAGRSTLFRLITGEEIAARGEMRLSDGDDDYYLEKAAALAP